MAEHLGDAPPDDVGEPATTRRSLLTALAGLAPRDEAFPEIDDPAPDPVDI